MKKKATTTNLRATPGPKPDVLKLRGNWKNAVRKSLTKKKPPSGWPK